MGNENEIKKQNKIKRNKITVLLISFYSGIIGISDLGLKYYLKDQNQMIPSTFSKILLIIKIAYLIKPIYGLLIDFVPIFGYKKKLYLFLCFVFNFASWYIFLFLVNNNLKKSIICHIIINITISFTAVIGNAIQLEISKLQNKQNVISKETSNFVAQKYLVKAIGIIIPSFLKGFLIEKYSYDIIFYMSGLFSLFILLCVFIFKEDKIEKIKHTKSLRNMHLPPLIEEEKEEKEGNCKLLNLINNKKILYLFSLIFILESTPSCVSPLFYYETNALGLNPNSLGLIDCTSQIAIIIFIILYNKFLSDYNFKSIIFFERILIFGSFSLIYLLINKSTQKYINDFVLITFSSSLYAGLHNLGQLPYTFLCIQFSSIGLEATTDAFSISCLYLGNMLADYIDYFLTLYYNVTHYNFIYLGQLVFVENIINLIPLIFIWAIPEDFLPVKKVKSSIELSSLKDKINNEDNNNTIQNDSNNNEEIKSNVESENKKDIVNNIVETFVDDEIGEVLDGQLTIENQNSYRYI